MLTALPKGNNQAKPEYIVSSEPWEERPDSFMWAQITGRYIPIILDFGNGSEIQKLIMNNRFTDSFDAAYRLSETTLSDDKIKDVPTHYIPPEHVFGEPKLLNQKTDIWALGASVCH